MIYYTQKKESVNRKNREIKKVREMGLEPTRLYRHKILSLLELCFHVLSFVFYSTEWLYTVIMSIGFSVSIIFFCVCCQNCCQNRIIER